MKRLRITILSAVAALAGLTVSSGAMAQATWNLYSSGTGTNGCQQSGTNSGSYGNSWNCTGSSGGTAKASAWSDDRGTSGTADFLAAPSTGSYYASAYLSPQGSSGFGAASRREGLGATSPNHAFDSIAPGTQDLLLLDFGSASVILDKIGIGWKGTDSDITLLRWTGSTAPTVVNTVPGSTRAGDGHQNLTKALATPTLAGWSLVGSYSNLAPDSSLPFGGTAVNTGATQASSWWLISTFNSALNGGMSCKKADGTTSTCDNSNDAFKLNFVSTKAAPPPGNVPEPGSLALAGLALAGLFVVRRSGKKQA